MSTKTLGRPLKKRLLKVLPPTARLERAVAAGEVVAALRLFGIKQRMIALSTGATERSVRNWKRTSAIASKYEDGLRKLQEIVLILTETLTPRGVGQWLSAPNRVLKLRRPIEVLAEGTAAAVRKAALANVEGTYV